MKKLLIAIDGSDHSIKALDYVIERKKNGDKIEALILNVQPAISSSGSPVTRSIITRSMIKEYQMEENERILGAPEVRARKNYLRADTYMEIGDPAARIVAFARKAKCQEIVMGCRGLGKIKSVLLGSVASKVVQTSPFPVVIVK